jgi:hypothetical protein
MALFAIPLTIPPASKLHEKTFYASAYNQLSFTHSPKLFAEVY